MDPTVSSGDVQINAEDIDEELLRTKEHLRHYTNRLIELGSKRNALAPITRLPDDTLSYIFTFLAHDPLRIYDKWDWIIVTHVCSRWRTIAANAQQFWSNFSKFSPVERVKRQLALSKDADLTVIFELKDPKVPYYKYVESLMLVLGQMDRIVELRINAMGDVWDFVLKELMRPSPRLRIISFEYCGQIIFDDVVESNNLTLPTNLYSASVTSIRLVRHIAPSSMAIQCLQSLTHLTLEETRFSMMELSFLLEACPKLEHLSLIRVTVTDNIWPHSAITMPFLRHLDIYGGFNPSHLLRCLTLPDDVSWNIDCCNDSDFMELFKTKKLPSLLKKPLECKKLCISAYDTAISIESTNIFKPDNNTERFVTTTLHLGWNAGMPEPMSRICSKVRMLLKNSYWKKAEIVQISVDGKKDEEILEKTWIDSLNPLQNMVFLGVLFAGESSNSRSEQEFAKALRRRLKNASFKICPSLKQLSLQFAEISAEFSLELEHSLRLRSISGAGIDDFWLYNASGLKDDHTCIAELSRCVGNLHWDEAEATNDGDSNIDASEHGSDGCFSDYESQSYSTDTDTSDVDYDELDDSEWIEESESESNESELHEDNINDISDSETDE